MADGQAETQPEVVANVSEAQLAHQAALRIIGSEAPAEVTEEAQPATEATAATEGEAPTETPQPEFDWEKVKAFKHKFKVKGEGGTDEEIEIPLEEMQSGYMRYK